MRHGCFRLFFFYRNTYELDINKKKSEKNQGGCSFMFGQRIHVINGRTFMQYNKRMQERKSIRKATACGNIF